MKKENENDKDREKESNQVAKRYRDRYRVTKNVLQL